MKLSIFVLFDELTKFSPVLHTNHTNIPAVRHIRALNIDHFSLMSYEYLYYADCSVIQENAGRLSGFELLSFGFIDDAVLRENDISVIMVDPDTDPYEVINRVQNCFEKYTAWEYDVLRLIAKRAGLKAVADKAAEVLVNPFVMIEASSRVIFAAGKIPEQTKGSIWENVMKYGHTSALEPGMDLLQREKAFDSYNRDVFFSELDSFPDEIFMNANVYLGGHRVARMGASNIYGHFTQGQSYLFKTVRDLLEAAIEADTLSESPADQETLYIEQLIRGQSVDPMIVQYHLARKGWTVSDHYRVYFIRDHLERALSDNYLKRLSIPLSVLKGRILFFQYENSVVLISRGENLTGLGNTEKSLVVLMEHYDLMAGVSDPFTDFMNIRLYYNQSKSALHEARIEKDKKYLYYFGDYYFAHIMHTLQETTTLESLIDPRIIALSAYDAEHATDYIHCLETYLVNGCNLAKASADLYMHRNTFTYKIGRIADLLGADIKEMPENERMKLWFSIKISNSLKSMQGRQFSQIE